MSQLSLLDVPATPHPDGATDSWFTPLARFLAWAAEFGGFTVDVSGHHEAPVSQHIGRFWDIGANGLSRSWAWERVWCNPPFSDIAPWVQRAHEEMRHACRLVVMLVPANRTEQPWWQTYIEPYRDRGRQPDGIMLTARFLPKRLQFGFPGDPTGETGESATFGCVLLIWTRSV